jgi:hypothetical protein
MFACTNMTKLHHWTSSYYVYKHDKTSSLNTFIILVQTWQNFITEHVYIKYLYKHDKTSSLKYYKRVQWWCFVMFVHVLWTCSVMKFCHVCTSIINVFSDEVLKLILCVQTWQNIITEHVYNTCTNMTKLHHWTHL